MACRKWVENPNWAPRLAKWPWLFPGRKKWMRPKCSAYCDCLGFEYATDEELALMFLKERYE